MRHVGRQCWKTLCLSTVLATAALLTVTTAVATAQTEDEATTLRVATKPLVPFVFLDEDAPRGYSIDVWDHIAAELDIETEWVRYDTVEEILEAVETGEADVAIAGISITAEREARLDFTHSYVDAGLQVYVTPTNSTPILSAVSSLFSWSGLLPILALIVLIIVVSHGVWLAERTHNPSFPTGYREGVREAVWWSTVNVITGGETVLEIRRTTSRILAVLWMLIGLLVMAYVTARITSVLTVNELQSNIEGIDDLAGRDVVSVEATAASAFLDDRGLGFSGATSLEGALDELDAGRAEAIVFDAPVLAYLAETDADVQLSPAGGVFRSDSYGIAVATGSPLREQLDEVVLGMNGDGSADEIYATWFGETR